MRLPILPSLSALLGVCLFAGAIPSAPATATTGGDRNNLPVLLIQEIETPSPESYALWISEVNKAVKQKIDVENYVKVFVGEVAGPDSGKVFASIGAESFSKLIENSELFEKELAMAKTRAGMGEIRKLGPQVGLKAVRWEGRNTTSVVHNTRVNVSDEASYLKSLDGLRGLLDGHDFKDVKLNCLRVVSGRSDYTHLVSMNAPSLARRAALIDALSSEPWAIEWIASVAKIRTVVSNGSYREITK